MMQVSAITCDFVLFLDDQAAAWKLYPASWNLSLASAVWSKSKTKSKRGGHANI